MAKGFKGPGMGRKEKVIEEAKLRAILRMKPTLKDCAAFFEVSEDQVEKYCKIYGNCTFSEFREQNMVHTRFSIIRKAIGKAEAGDNTMLIFCLKNLCGWVDKFDNTHTIQTEKLSTEELEKIVLTKAKELENGKSN